MLEMIKAFLQDKIILGGQDVEFALVIVLDESLIERRPVFQEKLIKPL